LVTVYNEKKWKNLERRLKEVKEIEDIGESIVIIGGDFNMRTGELGCDHEREDDRSSRDKMVSNDGKNLIGETC